MDEADDKIITFCCALTELCRSHNINLITDWEGNLYADACSFAGIKGGFAPEHPGNTIIRWK